jgi:hypothetical protein
MFAFQPPNHWTRVYFWLYFHMTADVLDPADGIFSDLQAPSPSPVPETQVCVLIVLGCKPGGSTTAFSDGYCPIVTCFPMGPTKRIETAIGGVLPAVEWPIGVDGQRFCIYCPGWTGPPGRGMKVIHLVSSKTYTTE